jgi:hypothetical protein
VTPALSHGSFALPFLSGVALAIGREPGVRKARGTSVLLPAVLGSCTGLYVAVRRIGGADGPARVHIADSDAAGGVMRGRFRRSEPVWRCREKRSVKPSAQPTLVRTQHLPPPAKTAPGLRKRDPAGRFLLVTSCISACHCGSMYGSVHVHMVYSVRAKLAVRITARFADLRPFCPVTGPPTAVHSGRPVLRCPLAPGGGLALLVPEAGAGWPDRARAISWRLHGGDDRVCGRRSTRSGPPRRPRRRWRLWEATTNLAVKPASPLAPGPRDAGASGGRCGGSGQAVVSCHHPFHACLPTGRSVRGMRLLEMDFPWRGPRPPLWRAAQKAREHRITMQEGWEWGRSGRTRWCWAPV